MSGQVITAKDHHAEKNSTTEWRGDAQLNWRVCSCVPSPGPRWTSRLHVAVASPTVLAFANFAVARHPQDHARWFLRESCNEAGSGSLCGTAHMIASPHQQGTFTVELSPGGSPRPDVDYDYTGKQPIPAAGLTPARHTTLWAANETHEKQEHPPCGGASPSRRHCGIGEYHGKLRYPLIFRSICRSKSSMTHQLFPFLRDSADDVGDPVRRVPGIPEKLLPLVH